MQVNMVNSASSETDCRSALLRETTHAARHIVSYLAIALLFSLQVMPVRGQEVIVALVDTGVSSSVNIAEGGYDFFADTDDTSDDTTIGHGSVAAQIIQSFITGSILPLKVTDGNFSSSQLAVDQALASIVSNANVRAVSISEGQSGQSSTIGDVSAAGKFIAIRSGNGFSNSPITLAQTSFTLPGVVIVGATGADEELLPSTNLAGQTANRYVATYGTTELSPVSGTSFAAARMAGIAAAVFAQNTNLNGEDVAQIIFDAAVDKGDIGTDPVWGRGFVADAAQVLNNPSGPPTIPGGGTADPGTGGSGGGGSSAAGAALLVGAAAGAAILLTRRGKLEKTLVLDSYGRPFEIDLNEHLEVASPHLSVGQFFHSYDERASGVRFDLGFESNTRVEVMYSTFDTEVVEVERYHAMAGDVVFAHRNINYSFSLEGSYENGFNYRYDHNANPAYRFGDIGQVAEQSGYADVMFLSGQSFAMPTLGFSERANLMSMGYTADSGMQVQMGLVHVDEAQDFGRESVAAILQGSVPLGERGSVSLQFGQLHESGSLFGGSNGGAFGVEDTETYALNLSGRMQVAEGITVVGNYGTGYSRVEDREDGLLQNFSGVRSDWFGLGVIADGVFSERDQVGVAVSQPLRITGGEVDYSVPYGLDNERNILKDTQRISLSPEGHERTIETYYRYRVSDTAEVGAYFMARTDPYHFKDEHTDYSVMTTLRLIY
jgi:hypothetical protein